MNALRVLTLCSWLLALGGMAASPFTIRVDSQKPLDAETEQALQHFVDEGAPVKQRQLAAHLESVMTEMKTVVALTDAEAAALTQDATKIIEASVLAWKPASVKCLRCYLVPFEDATARLRYVRQWTATEVAENHSIEGWVLPDALPEWSAAVRTRLDAPRAAKWLEHAAKITAEREKQGHDYLQRWASMARVSMDEDLRGLIESMRKELNLDQAKVDGLFKAASRLVDEHAAAEIIAGAELLRSQTATQRDKTFGSRNAFITRFMKPKGGDLEKAWAAAATQQLGTDGVQRWQRLITEQKEKEVREILAGLKPNEQQSRLQMDELIAREVEGYVVALDLDDTRKAALEKLAKQAVDASIEAARLSWHRSIEKASMAERKNWKNMSLGISAEDRPMKTEAWTLGLKKLFSETEIQRMKDGLAARKAQLNTALAQSTLAEMDRTLALNANQRTQLEPVLAPLMEPLVRDEAEEYWSFQPQQLMSAASKADEKVVRSILDESQWRRWSVLGSAQSANFRRSMEFTPTPVNDPALEAAPLDVETEIARHLHHMGLRERTERLSVMLARVEDARRVLGLPEDRVKRLTSAAKGAVEDDLTPWRQNVEGWVRGAVERTPPESLKAALLNLDRSNYSSPGKGAEKSDIWRSTVVTLLSASELQAWKKVIDERRAYQVAALASMSTNELDRRRRLTTEQHAKMKKLIIGVLTDYLPDIERYMSQSWHLQYYYSLLPLAGMKEEALKAVLTERQWKQVQERDLVDARQYWEGIENYHQQRLKGQDGDAGDLR